MAFTDPQSVTIAGTAISLPRTNVGNNGSEYRSSDDLVKLSLNHAYGRRTRRVIRIDHSKLTSDPFIPSNNTKVSMSCYMVFDVPPAGYTNGQAKEVYVGFNTLVTASVHAAIDKLLGGES